MAHYGSGFQKYLSIISNRLLENAIWTFADLGIADLLAAAGTPQTAYELAQKQGWNGELLYRLLRLVADADIVREIKSTENNQLERTNQFELTEDGHYLTCNHPSRARYLLCWELSSINKRVSLHLPQLIREGYSKGNAFQQEFGNTSLFQFLEKEENQNVAHSFSEAMSSYSSLSRQSVVNAVDFSRFNTIVDIGGSLGALLSSILEKYSTIKLGICFDLSNVIEQSKISNEIEKQNISKDRYQFLAGDMFNPGTIPQVDAYIMKHIIHDWDDTKSIEILKSIRTAANGQPIVVFIIDLVISFDDKQNQFVNQFAHAIDVHMMTVASGKERTQKQFQYLFEESGFTFKHLYHTETPYSILEVTAN